MAVRVVVGMVTQSNITRPFRNVAKLLPSEKPAQLVIINMEVTETKLEPPDNFRFPFTPYDIQKDFMFNLYQTLENKKLGIFESPTGTGKSMSLICGSLAWLLDHEARIKNDLTRNITLLTNRINQLSSNDSSNWLEIHSEQLKDKQKKDVLQDHLNRINQKEEKLENIRMQASKLPDMGKSKKNKGIKVKKQSNKENENVGIKEDKDQNVGSVDEDEIVLVDAVNHKDSSDESDSDSEEEEYYGIKIYFCSRTHSQLSQLVHEIQKSPYRDLKVSVVSLSSRQNYCINDDVLKLKNLSLISERCKDLHSKQKTSITSFSDKGEKLKKMKIASHCPFYHQTNMEDMKLKILTEIKDVEDIAQLGGEYQGCPYYAARLSVSDAHVILVPYNMILHKSTREACKIRLKNSVVIIDEAHNLLDAIAGIHSSIMSGYQLICAYSQIMQYRDKFHDKFSPYNLLRINQLIYILKNFIHKIGAIPNVHPDDVIGEISSTTVESLPDFTLSCEIDTINLFDVLEFAKRSGISQKLHGFALKYRPFIVIKEKASEKKGVATFLKNFGQKTEIAEEPIEDYIEGNPMLSVLSFLESLTNHYDDGRIVCTKARTVRDSSMKFLLLNPASHFSDIVKEARSVVLAGGTMQPVSEFTDQLFLLAGASPDRITTFSCGHVVHEDNIHPIIVSTGPTGKTFDFSYQHRADTGLIEELGRLLVNVCNIVPAGVVCFFPSYDYENSIYQCFEKTNVISKLENKKKVLREPKKSNQVDEVLRDYSKAAKKGAILFSVVGGKLSEGLNFNDDLGRCVIVVGLPYPNLMSPELKEKMNYLNATVGPNSGKEYYENLCMKAVNQSIGRSVRHKDDYASVLLVDRRYARTQCQNALPKWIRKSLHTGDRFGVVMGSLAKFFNAKRNATER